MNSNLQYARPRRHDDGNRKFYELPDKCDYLSDQLDQLVTDTDNASLKTDTHAQQMFELIARSEIGYDEKFLSPFGLRQIVYCDYTASGRSLSFIEDFIRQQVLPEYGNTHTTSTATSLQTTLFRTEARDIIRNSVHASEHDCLIFVGTGCTGAVHKLINALCLTEPPVVFVSPYEHHSNLLPWRELMSEVVFINESENGSISLTDLEEKLLKYKDDTRVKIGSFSAASNITGILSDVDKITILLHKYGFLSFWDYATAAPHLEINMNPYVPANEANKELAYKDAVFISIHKFVGGPQTPGILIAKKKLFKNRVPNGGGGGTVFYVTEKDHRYLKNEEYREEGGTPAIVESIRAGMVFQLKDAIGVEAILNRENQYTKHAINFLSKIPNLYILGSLKVERLPLFSFLVKHEQTGLYLHSNFVSALLNDLFGIQSRSGCACAGPYAQYLMGISYELAKAYEEVLVQDERMDRTHLRLRNETTRAEVLRPGFVRLNLAFFMSEQRISFILNAIKFVCEHGWRFLPFYICNLETGEFRHRNLQVFKDRKWLSNINYKDGKFVYNRKEYRPKESHQDLPLTDEDCLQAAYTALEATKQTLQIADQRLIFSETTQNMRWFLLPSEAYGIIHNIKSLYSEQIITPPFTPRYYPINNLALLNKLYPTHVHTDSPVKNSGKSRDISYADHANLFYFDEEADRLVKLVRKEIINKASNKVSDARIQESLFAFDRNKIENDKEEDVDKSVEQKVSGSNKNEAKSPDSLICKRIVPNVDKPVPTRYQWHSPPKTIFKPFTEAIQEFGMIKNGDRVLVCLSGGKDSMSLLHAMKQYQYFAKSKNIEFEFGAVTVDPKTPAYNPSSLKSYLAELGVPYFYEEQTIIQTAENLPYECASICSFCSRMKRGRIYHTARKNGYNVLALGQHLDDMSESFMMSLFYNGKLWCMKASYQNEEGDLRITRPFVYVREKDLRAFAEGTRLPIIPENCPGCFEAPKERQRMKQLLAQQEVHFPHLFSSLLTAIKPIISIDQCKVSIKSLSELGLKMIKENEQLYQSLLQSSKDSDESSNRGLTEEELI